MECNAAGRSLIAGAAAFSHRCERCCAGLSICVRLKAVSISARRESPWGKLPSIRAIAAVVFLGEQADVVREACSRLGQDQVRHVKLPRLGTTMRGSARKIAVASQNIARNSHVIGGDLHCVNRLAVHRYRNETPPIKDPWLIPILWKLAHETRCI